MLNGLLRARGLICGCGRRPELSLNDVAFNSEVFPGHVNQHACRCARVTDYLDVDSSHVEVSLAESLAITFRVVLRAHPVNRRVAAQAPASQLSQSLTLDSRVKPQELHFSRLSSSLSLAMTAEWHRFLELPVRWMELCAHAVLEGCARLLQ